MGALGGQKQELLPEPLCRQPVLPSPGNSSCSWGCFWALSGLCPGCSTSRCLFRAAPGPAAAGSPGAMSVPALAGHPSAHPWDVLGTDRTLQSPRTRGPGCLSGFLVLYPTFPASWDTQTPRNIAGSEQGTLRGLCAALGHKSSPSFSSCHHFGNTYLQDMSSATLQKNFGHAPGEASELVLLMFP